MKDWNVYILRCGDGTLYTGATNNLDARLQKHQCGKGGAYTRTHLPVEFVHQEKKLTRSQALVREAQIKKLPRQEKLRLAGLREGSSSILQNVSSARRRVSGRGGSRVSPKAP